MTETSRTAPATDSPEDRAVKRPRRLLVGVDGSAESVTALRRAVDLADAMGGTVRVITCWSYPVLDTGLEALPFDLLEQGARDAQDEAMRLAFGNERPRHVETAIIQGGASRVLVEESRNADLVVVGSRGHGGFAGLLLGSVSTACAEHARCDVLVVRDRA